MSKTFKCVEHEEEVLEVYPFIGDEAGRKFSLLMPHVSSNAGIAFDSTTAPALALAILEAAGVVAKPSNDDPGTPGNLGRIAYQLMTHIEDAENITAEAEAQAKLEAEALELCNAAIRQEDGAIYDSFSQVPTPDLWLAVARKARELNKEDNNA